MQMITKDEATAAQRTLVFFAADATDGFTAEPAIDFSQAGDVRLSKAGAALANATGVVTELASGYYKLVLSAADVDTLGDLVVTISNAGVRTITIPLQVIAFDLNTATVPLAADAIGSSQIAASAVTELAGQYPTRTAVIRLGTLSVDGDENTDGDKVAVSTVDTIDTVITVAGTWNGATATVQTCPDPTAAVPVWTISGVALTADGSVTVNGGGHVAARVLLSNDGASTALVVTAVQRKHAGS